MDRYAQPAPQRESVPAIQRKRDERDAAAPGATGHAIPGGDGAPQLPSLQAAASSAGADIQRRTTRPAIPTRSGLNPAGLWLKRALAGGLVQRSATTAPPPMSGKQVEGYLANPSGGRTMDTAVQAKMERGFGRSMGGVKVHTDSAADLACKSLGAQAFTNGNNVYFAQGKYNPTSSSGQHLLAHELTHTIQQTGGGRDVHAKLEVGGADTTAEREADSIATMVVQRSDEGASPAAPAPADTQEVAPEQGAAGADPAVQDPELAALSPEEREAVQQEAGDQRGAGGASGAAPQQAAPETPTQTKLVVGKPGDRYEQEADRVASEVTSGDASRKDVARGAPSGQKKGAKGARDAAPEKGYWKVMGHQSRPISGPTGVAPGQMGPSMSPTEALQMRPAVSAAPGGSGAPVQRMGAEAIAAAAAVVQVTWQIVNDVVRAMEDDVTWSFDRMTGIKCPGDNSNWNNVDGAQWTEHSQDIWWYKQNGWGTDTGMKVRLHWESNGYAINGVYFTKRDHTDAAGWGASFTWLVQNLQASGTGARGFPKAKVRWAVSASWTRSLASTIHGNDQGTIDAEGMTGT